MARMTLQVNGTAHTVDADPSCPLLYVLRDDLKMNNPRFGCGLGQCGSCMIIMNGDAVRSCILPVSLAAGKTILTLEGLGTAEDPDPVQRAFIEKQAFECGYCLNGWVMTTKALLDQNPNPSEAQIGTALEDVICRCGAHERILAAVHLAAELKGQG
jgi:nicotinate dehydrogenase subunit A